MSINYTICFFFRSSTYYISGFKKSFKIIINCLTIFFKSFNFIT